MKISMICFGTDLTNATVLLPAVDEDTMQTYLLILVHGQTRAGHTKLEEEHNEQDDHVLENRAVKGNYSIIHRGTCTHGLKAEQKS